VQGVQGVQGDGGSLINVILTELSDEGS